MIPVELWGMNKYSSIALLSAVVLSSGKDASSERFSDFISNDLQNFEQKCY